MYPFASLPENLAAFCAFLRRDHGFRIGPGDLHDAARALDVVDISDVRAVRHALRPLLSTTLDDAMAFDEAFARFFFPRAAARRNEMPSTRERGSDPDGDQWPIERGRAAPSAADTDDAVWVGDGSLTPMETADRDHAEPVRLSRSSYSPLAGTAAAPRVTAVDAVWREAARSLIRRLHLGLSRRWRPAARGRRFDVRRTLRASLQTGAEPLSPRWLRRPRRTPQIVLLIDGSRSMGVHAQTMLQVAVALATATRRLEVFTFSTSLQRVTGDVRRAAAGEARCLEQSGHAWGGGTSIGGCLREFLGRFGDRLVARHTVVIIASDGLDVGEPALLRDATRELHRRSAGIIWLNPLLDTPGYEPTASGMRAARPYVGTFASVSDAAGLARLSRAARVRAISAC